MVGGTYLVPDQALPRQTFRDGTQSINKYINGTHSKGCWCSLVREPYCQTCHCCPEPLAQKYVPIHCQYDVVVESAALQASPLCPPTRGALTALPSRASQGLPLVAAQTTMSLVQLLPWRLQLCLQTSAVCKCLQPAYFLYSAPTHYPICYPLPPGGRLQLSASFFQACYLSLNIMTCLRWPSTKLFINELHMPPLCSQHLATILHLSVNPNINTCSNVCICLPCLSLK